MIKCIGYSFYSFFIDAKKNIFIIVLLCLNIITMFFTINNNVDIQTGEIYGDYVSHDKINIKYTVESSVEFYDNIRLVCNNTEKNMDQSSGIYSEYHASLLKVYRNIYNSVKISDSDFSGTQYFKYDYNVVFIVASILLFSITTYGEDISLGIISIIKTTKNGRLKLALAKQISVILFIFLSVIIFLSSELLVYGNELIFNAPIQTIQDMAICPYNISVGQYLIIHFFNKFVFITVFILICNIVICTSRSIIKSCLYSICVAAICWITSLMKITSIFNFVNYISIYKMSMVKPLFSQYNSIIIGNRLYSAISIVLTFYAIVGIALFVVDIYIYSYYHIKTIQIKSFKKAALALPLSHYIYNKSKTYSMSIWICEFYKCIIMSGGYLIILLSLVMSIIICVSSNYNNANNVREMIYHEYISYYSGGNYESSLWSELKAEDILVTARELDIKKELRLAADNDFLYGKITIEEYENILTECRDADIRRDVFKNIETYEEYLSETKNGSFVYDTGWNKLFTRDIDFPVYIAILLLAASMFAIEHEKKTSSYGMDIIIKTTVYGRNITYINKLFVLTTCCICISIISEVISILFIMRSYMLPLYEASAESLMMFNKLSPQITILGIFIINEFVRVITLLLFAFIIAGMAEIMQKRLGVIILGACILIFPKLISNNINIMNINSDYFIIIETILLIIAVIGIVISKTKWNNKLGR